MTLVARAAGDKSRGERGGVERETERERGQHGTKTSKRKKTSRPAGSPRHDAYRHHTTPRKPHKRLATRQESVVFSMPATTGAFSWVCRSARQMLTKRDDTHARTEH